jgi:hypothetical protein
MLRNVSGIDDEISPIYAELRTLYRHHQAIRDRLAVTAGAKTDCMQPRGHVGRRSHGQPADLINVAIEELVRQRIELPAFSTFDRMSRRIRTLVNGRFAAVMERLSETEREQLDALLEIGNSPQKKTLFFALKQLPKRSSLEHLQDLLDHIVKLSDTVGADHHLSGIPFAKIKHFAAEAKALDAAELKKFAPPKRYVLILSLIHRARVQARDDLAEMFIKRMNHIHRRGKDELERLRIKFARKPSISSPPWRMSSRCWKPSQQTRWPEKPYAPSWRPGAAPRPCKMTATRSTRSVATTISRCCGVSIAAIGQPCSAWCIC